MQVIKSGGSFTHLFIKWSALRVIKSLLIKIFVIPTTETARVFAVSAQNLQLKIMRQN